MLCHALYTKDWSFHHLHGKGEACDQSHDKTSGFNHTYHTGLVSSLYMKVDGWGRSRGSQREGEDDALGTFEDAPLARRNRVWHHHKLLLWSEDPG